MRERDASQSHPGDIREMSQSATGAGVLDPLLLQIETFSQPRRPMSRSVTGRPVFNSKMLQIEIFQRRSIFRLNL